MNDYGRGRLIVVSFDPGETTGWAWHCTAKQVVAQEGVRVALRDMRKDVPLSDMTDLGRELDLGYEYGQFGIGDKMNEDQQVDEMVRLIRGAWAAYEPDVAVDTFSVVTERFTLRMMGSDSSLLAPVRLNAKLEREMRNIGALHLQTPADAKRTVTDARLRSWNVYDSHSGDHARDAQRHGILFMRRWATQSGLRLVCGLGRGREAVAVEGKSA